MSNKIISSGRTIDSVAYDLALVIASRDPSVSTPEALLAKITELLPECIKLVSAKASEEKPPPSGKKIKARI